jgi:hypothetical protein
MSGVVVPPPSGGGGDGGFGLPQTPLVWPGWMMQTLPEPGQQSPVLVHLAPVITQAVVPQTSWPLMFGTQTLPPQQSAEVAHANPGPTHMRLHISGVAGQLPTVKQRGTPTASRRQVILSAPGLLQQFELTPLTEQPLGSGLHASFIGLFGLLFWQVLPLSQQKPAGSKSWQ